ncbi:uncharacterized protein VTP21DRAFT_8889 [Calcarisporiella thermophila]|uniref:uncharacterized protein n=1 Tax=Calcarisporiella thermophila TaxID=911321 RepID=UPI0037431A15
MKFSVAVVTLALAATVLASPPLPRQVNAAAHCDGFAEIDDQRLSTYARPDHKQLLEKFEKVKNLECKNLASDKPIKSIDTAKYTHSVFYKEKDCKGATVYDGLGPDKDANIVAKSFRLYCGENPFASQ